MRRFVLFCFLCLVSCCSLSAMENNRVISSPEELLKLLLEDKVTEEEKKELLVNSVNFQVFESVFLITSYIISSDNDFKKEFLEKILKTEIKKKRSNDNHKKIVTFLNNALKCLEEGNKDEKI